MRFSFAKSVKPWEVTQAWGIFNPAYQRFGFTRHNGIDVRLGTDKLVRAPFPATVIRAATKENGEWQPDGGGIFLSILSGQEYEFDDGVKAYVLADFLHCDRLVSRNEDPAVVGTVLSVQDNTGFSTGPHTHIQTRRVKWLPDNGQPASAYRRADGLVLFDVDKNDANNSFDPTPYFTDTYAGDDLLHSYVKATGLSWLLNFFKR